MIEARHIQDHTANSTTKKYWAYPDRILPCTKDAGTCAYLDSVYHSHEISMLYTFILWAVLGGVLMFMLSLRYGKSVSRSSDIKTPLRRGLDSLGSLGRRWMLSEAPGRGVLGRVTLLQVTVLSALLGYLLIFSLVGVTYKTWITPTKNHPELKTIRTGFGGWGDRVGALAYALTPLTIALCSRESVLSLITGIPYQHFNFLHRWTGRVIFIQSFLHTLVWTLVEGRFYQPQPETYTTFIKQKYIVWGIVAQIMITFLYIFSTSWAIRLTGYEFFKKTHALVGILYLGACWGHWDKLACWMIASLIIVLGDFGVRFLRTGLLHFGYRKGKPRFGFHSAIATVQHYGDDEDSVVRVDFDFKHSAWKPGQHFYLCFPALNIWQSHPFTPSSLPDGRSDIQHHTYLIRERSGITAKLAQIARATGGDSCTTSVILTGPYGGSSTEESADSNLLAVAGGTGVTSVLPTLQDTFTVAQTGTRAVDLVWIVRKIQDLSWIAPELTELKSWMSSGKADGLRLRIFVTREHAPPESSTSSTSSISEKGKGCCSKRAKGEKNGIVVTSSNDLTALQNNFSITYLGGSHPSIKDIVSDFSERTAICGGRSQVIGAGPMEIGTALRSAVAKENHAGKVWQGDESGIMALEWDCRS
ncbi:hypothetical protein D6C80_01446 [Aureobasidium pullulans]|nr:hypothetical protein D6C80_01446 [Aureobasidium pullulans]